MICGWSCVDVDSCACCAVLSACACGRDGADKARDRRAFNCVPDGGCIRSAKLLGDHEN